MAILTHCPNCAYSIGPTDTRCPRCGTAIQRQSVGTVAFTRPVQAFFDMATGGRGTAVNIPLLDTVPLYTVGRPATPASSGQAANMISVDHSALAVAAFHARIQLDNRDPSTPLWRFEDLGSPNGSYRNNQRVRYPVRLDDGDEIWLGPVGGPTSVRLVYHDPIDRPPVKRWLLHPGGHNPLKVGRNVSAGHLRLFGENASDHHATITKTSTPSGTTYDLEDAASSNGTFVNGRHLAPGQRVTLKDGDLVRFGKAQYNVQQLDASRLLLLPLGVEASEHIVGQGLFRTVTIEANMWLSQYVRYVTRRTFNPGAGQHYGATLTPPQRDKVLLSDVDIVVGPNDFVVLAGSSGSGKSTLLHILSTFIYPQAGGLWYKGQDYKDNPRLLRPNMGYVPQDDIVHEQLTVFEELMYAAELRLPATFSREERESRVHAVLKQLRLVPQTRQRINRLSGGQRKRVSIAVELLNRPGILFLDEPTEGQDLALEQSLIIMLRNLANDGTSIVLISHRLNFLDYADYVGWLAPGGHLVYFGPPDQVSDYFGINPDFSPAQRYAAVYDKLDQSPDPIRLAGDFKRSAHYQEFIQMRRQPGAALGMQTGPLSTGGVPTQQGTVQHSAPVATAQMPQPQQAAMPYPIQPGINPVARVPVQQPQISRRPATLPPMPGVSSPQQAPQKPPQLPPQVAPMVQPQSAPVFPPVSQPSPQPGAPSPSLPVPPTPQGVSQPPTPPIPSAPSTAASSPPTPPQPGSNPQLQSQSPQKPPAPPPPTPYGSAQGVSVAPTPPSPASPNIQQGAPQQGARPLVPPPAPPTKGRSAQGGAVPAQTSSKPGSWTTTVSTPPNAPPVSPPPAPPVASPYKPPQQPASVVAPTAQQQWAAPPLAPPQVSRPAPYPAQAQAGAYPQPYQQQYPYPNPYAYMPMPALAKRPQFFTLLRRDKALVQSDWSFLSLMVVQPFVIGLLLFFLSDSKMFTQPQLLGQTVLFAMSVSAVYLGVLLSMRELVKERGIYRRERMVGLRLAPYLSSKIMVLSFFSLYQSFVLVALVLLKAPTPAGGALFWAPLEMFITVFLTAFGGMSLGLLLSALARTQEVLGALVPMVMIPQFLLSKVVITLPGFLDPLGRLMFTNWATEAMGDSVGITAQNILPGADPSSTLDYAQNAGHLLLRWLVLIALSALFLAFAWLRQMQRDKFKG